ncbi:MAG: hypothetical protein Q9213_006708 [Squamulea squamosa]
MSEVKTVTTGRSDEEKKKALADLSNLQDSQQLSKTTVKEFVSTIHACNLFKTRWDEILSTAPLAVSMLGACKILFQSSPPYLPDFLGLLVNSLKPRPCRVSAQLATSAGIRHETFVDSSSSGFIASTVESSQGVMVEALGQGFQHMTAVKGQKKASLNALLILCATAGSEAFTNANTSMADIHSSAGHINNDNGTLKKIMTILSHHDDAQASLAQEVNTLQRYLNDCAKAADSMDQAFEEYMQMTAELNACMSQTADDDSALLIANKVQLDVENTTLLVVDKDVEAAQQGVKDAKETLDTTKEAFKKASDQIPHGGIKQAIPLLVQGLTPGGEAKQGLNIFEDVMNQNGKGARNDKITARPRKKQSPPNPESYDDPAYTHIITVMQQVGLLRSLLSAKDGGVDWEHILLGRGDRKSGLGCVLGMLQYYKDKCKSPKTEPSKKLAQILDTGLRTSKEIQEMSQAESIDKNSLPGPKSKKVIGWQKDVDEAYQTASKLSAVSKTASGAGGRTPHLIARDQTIDTSQQQSPAFRDALLDTATHHLDTTAAEYKAAQEILKEATKSLIEQQDKVAQIQGELAKLNSSDKALEAAKAVLLKCIGFVIEIKKDIQRLKLWLNGMALLCEHLVKGDAQELLDTLKDSDSESNKQKFGIYTFSNFQRQTVYTHVITLAGYIEGLGVVDDMSRLSNNGNDQVDTAKKIKELNEWTNKAQKDIARKVLHDRQALESDLDGLSKTADDLVRGFMVQQPEHVKQAIDDGRKESTDAAKKHNEEHPTPVANSGPEFSTNRDPDGW